jgi:hypothetical protein
MSLQDFIADLTDISSVTFNGKWFFAYSSSVDRLHVWEPTGAPADIRRVGLAQPAAPTGAQIAGAVTDTRTYKVAFTKQSGGITLLRSELSAASAAQVMAAQQTTVTRPTLINEGETHWELYAASATTTNGLYYLIATTIVATATAADNNAAIPTTTEDPVVGINSVFPSVKFLSTDNNRLFGAGQQGHGAFTSRIWFTPVLGDNNIGDDERYVNSLNRKTYIDLNANDGGAITGLSPSMQGALYAFKLRQIYKLTPTGDPDTPYLPYKISDTVGCIDNRTIKLGEDQAGNPCLYFASLAGPYRLGVSGLEYIGRDVEDIWDDVQIDLSFCCHAVYYPNKKQYWLWVTVDGTTGHQFPEMILVFNVLSGTPTDQGIRGGWATYDGPMSRARCAVLFANSTTSGIMSKLLKPYLGLWDVNDAILKGDDETVDADNSTLYQAYLFTRAYQPAGKGIKFNVLNPVLQAKSQPGVSVSIGMTKDYGVEPTKFGAAVSLASAAQSRVVVKVEVTESECKAIQFTIGDQTVLDTHWTLDSITVPYEPREEN